MENQVTQPTVAGKLTDLRKLRACGVAGIAIAFVAFALMATPALAEPFGLQALEASVVNENGSPDVQAGSHPYALKTNFLLNKPEELEEVSHGQRFVNFRPAGEGLKDVRVEAPPGFVGDPNATPKCSYQAFVDLKCPDDTAVGEATTILSNGGPVSDEELIDSTYTVSDPVFNVETPGGIAAEFGYVVDKLVPIFLDASVRTGFDYGITVNVRNIPQTKVVYGAKITIWGVPAAPRHNKLRGKCLSSHVSRGSVDDGLEQPHDEEESERELDEKNGQTNNLPPGECPVDVPVVPLLTNPTSCGVPRSATLGVDDWEKPGNFATEPGNLAGEDVFSKTVTLPELSGCEKLDFSPSLSVQPDGTAGSTPTGLNVEVHVPQEATTNPEGLGEADVKDTTVALPAGVQISPSAADGLQACSNAQIGFTGANPQSGADEFTPNAPSCPDASKIANARIATPLLEHELTGAVYLAAPQNFAGLPENPFSSLLAMYLVVEEPATGVLVKLPGKVSLNEVTGQITATFENTPQLPFSDLKLEFYGTARAPLATPALCGTYNTEASLVPWSGTPTKNPPASFQITSGPNGTACSDPLPFSPSLESGTTNINAGSFTALTTTLSREDGQQSIQSVQLHYPPGVSGLLSGVKLCGEAEANAGTCGPESEIGETIVSVGLGNDPFTVTGGRVYLTGPYNGTSTCAVGSPGCAPFGLSIVNPAKAGPFDLQEGRPVVVRATINVDPQTAALTVTTNTAADGYAIPHIIDGIALQIKHVDVDINRADFVFNPTNCAPTQITGMITSAEGASSPVSIPFQAGECRSLKFAPDFKASTQGKTSKANGASLTTKIIYPPGQAYANIAKVKVDLPKQLPSRLTTLQKACTSAQFDADPAGCPSASVIGHAKAITPLLPVPLEGPAYFVSRGGEAFPQLIMVLQGYGVTIDLVGDTFISKAGITSSTFNTVPDQPVTSFELVLPEGPYSALGTNKNLCTQKLLMPTALIAQNGLEIHETTKISVSGCAKIKPLTRAQKLTKALRVCRKDKNKGKRATCERGAHKKYGKVKKGKKK
jgi:hypothetical protein